MARIITSRAPETLHKIAARTRQIGFEMGSDPGFGALLRTLVRSKAEGNFLELGTGTGLSLCWMADGMGPKARLVTIDNNPQLMAIAREFLGNDPRIDFLCGDAAKWLGEYEGKKFDLVFADAWPGKYSHLQEIITFLNPGGFYIVDDMDKQPNWPEGHEMEVQKFVSFLDRREDLIYSRMTWSTGIIIAVKK